MSSNRQELVAPPAVVGPEWDCAAPPRIEPFGGRIRVVFGGVTVADTSRAVRVVENGRRPVYYVPPEDVLVEHLVRSDRQTVCAFKGVAIHYAVIVGQRVAPVAAWSYPDPVPAAAMIARHLAFCPQAMDECWIDDQRATAEPDDACGWVGPEIAGGFASDANAAGR